MGLLDLASELSAGVRHSTMEAQYEFEPIRAPRVIGPDNIVRPYSRDDAQGREIMLRLNKRHSEEKFVACLKIGIDRMSVLVTSDRVVWLDFKQDKQVFLFSLYPRCSVLIPPSR